MRGVSDDVRKAISVLNTGADLEAQRKPHYTPSQETVRQIGGQVGELIRVNEWGGKTAKKGGIVVQVPPRLAADIGKEELALGLELDLSGDLELTIAGLSGPG